MSSGEPSLIGVDFGGTTIKLAVVSGSHIICRGSVIDTQQHSAPRLLDLLVEEILRIRALRPESVAVGVGLPGLVDSVNGIVHELSNVPGWSEVPLRKLLAERTGLPSIIENDANAMTYGEWKFGAGQNAGSVVCVTLGTGVGGGLILDGRLYRGSGLGAGEVGQMSIDYRGLPGAFNNLGALEGYVGNARITERGLRLFREAGKTPPAGELTPALLAAEAAAGDPIAAALWEEIGIEIGAGLANVVWLLNPDRIIIGGGVANAGEMLFEPIRRIIRERTAAVFHENLLVVPAKLGTDAGMIGCAALAADSLPSHPVFI